MLDIDGPENTARCVTNIKALMTVDPDAANMLADQQREARAGMFSAGRTPPEPNNDAVTCLGCRNGVPDFPWCTSTQVSPPE